MKMSILLPASIVVVTGLVIFVCKAGRKDTTKGKQLPASCTLQTMSPQDRAAHLRRLDNLTQAASLKRKTREGFVFTVDLHRMSVEDLQLWMKNEQECCSFLKLTNRVFQRDGFAEVTVTCPVDMRATVMQTFGIRAKEKGP